MTSRTLKGNSYRKSVTNFGPHKRNKLFQIFKIIIVKPFLLFSRGRGFYFFAMRPLRFLNLRTKKLSLIIYNSAMKEIKIWNYKPGIHEFSSTGRSEIIHCPGEYRMEKNHRSEFALTPTLENRMRLKKQKFHEAFFLCLTT